MKLVELAVKRPVTTVMLFTGIIIMGTISLFKIPQELLPSLVYPQVTVVTSYENATPEEIERQVTKIVEESVGTVSNLKSLNSISREGISLVMAEFNWGTNMDLASMDVREKIDLIKERLPRESEEPIVMKFNPFELPVLTMLLSNQSGTTDAKTLYQMKEAAKNIIKNSLEKIEGVASVEIKGGREREILVDVDQNRLQASDLSLLEIVNILKNANMAYPAGTIKKQFYEYLIRTMGEFKDIDDIKATPVKVQYYEDQRMRYFKSADNQERPKGLITLGDIARVSDTFKKEESILRHNKKESLSIDIKKQSGTNIVKVVDKIIDDLGDIRRKLPDDYKLEVIYNQSDYVKKSISGVAGSAIMGGVLAFLVLYLFLRNLENSLIVTVSIPVSLMGTFILMYFQGISINMMSLGGLALGVGMLVDNSVVVLENIYRMNVENPGHPIENAISGTSEVTGAITSSTLTTITVFLPFVFISGVAGQLFKELAYTVTFSLITSLIVSITLIPRLASKAKHKEFKEPGWSVSMKNLYNRMLVGFFKRKGSYLAIIALLFIGSIFVIMNLDREFIPKTRQREFIIKADLPPGTKIDATDNVAKRIENILFNIKEVADVTTSIGSSKGSKGKEGLSLMEANQAEILVKLQGPEGYADEIIKRLKNNIKSIDLGGADIEYITRGGIFGSALSGAAPVSIDIKGDNMEELIKTSKGVEDSLSHIPEIYGVKSSFKGYRPEVKIEVNKDRASLYDISTKNVTLTAQTAIKGYVATTLKEQEEQVDIRVALAESDRTDFNQIGNIIVRSPLKFDVKLNQIASFKEQESTAEIRRKEGQRIISITANYLGGSLSETLNKVKAAIQHIKNSAKDIMIEIAGENEKMKESFGELMFVIVLSILFVYMIMASQFESLWQPFIVIFTVPLSMIGVSVFLLITSTTLNVVALLGIIMLGGIVVNNGIVLISYFNILETEEGGLEETVIRASLTRLRPVLMTAMTTTLGLIPMAVSGGQGSELRSPLAITVIGGLLTSTFLTLFVIPAIYIIGERFLISFKITFREKFIDKISW